MFAFFSNFNAGVCRLALATAILFIAVIAPSAAQNLRPQITMPLEHVYSGQYFEAFVPAQKGWCGEQVTWFVHAGAGGIFMSAPNLADDAVPIATAVRKRCPQMRTAVIYMAFGAMDNPTFSDGYEGFYEETLNVASFVSTKSASRFGNSEPIYTFVISKADQVKISANKVAVEAEQKRRAEGKFGVPNVGDMQAYITRSMATIFESDEVRGHRVSNTFMGEAVFSRTTVVDTIECTKQKEQYRCTSLVRSTNGPSLLQGRESNWSMSSFIDTCSWASPGKLKCNDVDARVSEALSKRAKRGNSNGRAVGTSNFDYDKHQKTVYCTSFGMTSMAAFSFGSC